MKKSLVALAAGSFVLGFAQFVMMGIISVVAEDLGVSVAWAGNFITAYAVGVVVGALILIPGRKVPPRTLIMGLMVLAAVGNAASAIAFDPTILIIGRFIAGLPHGAFFGTAALAAKMLADPGCEGRAVSTMVLGQTVANTVGVPLGTLLASALSWQAAFVFATICAVVAVWSVGRYVPELAPIPDTGLAGQFRFLRKPGPWMVIAAVLLGNTGLFTWWSYVSPWLGEMGGIADALLPVLLVVAGLGMTAGGVLGGRLSDAKTPAVASVVGQAVGAVALALITLVGRGPVACTVLTFITASCIFIVSGPQQVLMVEVGQGGGELLAGAFVQMAFNGGSAVGSVVGQMTLGAGAGYEMVGIAGVPFSVAAALLLVLFAWRYEQRYHLAATQGAS